MTVADVGFGRLHILAGGCFDPVGGNSNQAPVHAVGAVFFQKFLYGALRLAIFAFPEVVITNSSIPIDEVLGRPVMVVERLPNPAIAVDRNWVNKIQIANSVFYVDTFSLKRELGRMNTDHNQARVLILCRPAFQVGLRPQRVDAGVRPNIDQHNLAAQ